MRLALAVVALAALASAARADDGENKTATDTATVAVVDAPKEAERGQRQRTKETRTALHVARSLDPAEMEEMTVRTRTGETATLLVKRRERDRDGRRVGHGLPFVRPEAEARREATERDAKAAVPAPVTVRSTPVLVKGQGEWPGKRARSVTSVDEDGVPVVEGVRVPDDESDKTMVWRNARVIDGKLVPCDDAKHAGGDVGKPKPKPKPVTPEEIQWTKLEPVRPGAWHAVKPKPKPAAVDKFKPSELVSVMVTPDSRLDEGGRYVRDRILEYIRRINAQEVSSRRGGARSMEAGAVAEPRVLQPAGASVYPTSLLYSPPSVVSRVSFEEGVRTPVLQYAHPELGVQPAAKVVATTEGEGARVGEGGNPAVAGAGDRREQALAYFAHDIHADRSPYAFEPGLEEEARADDAASAASGNDVGERAPPPAPRRPQHPQRPRKTLPYFYGAERPTADKYYADKYYGGKYTPYGKYADEDDQRPFWQRVSDSIRDHVRTGMDRVSELAAPVVDPLVEASHKISKNLGLEGGGGGGGQTGYRELDTIKEKLGLGAGAGPSSVVLPALGLVAGGAALGLGAVAVGRYLDVDMLQRSRQESGGAGGDDGGLSVEHKRALEAVAGEQHDDDASAGSGSGGAAQRRLEQAEEALEVVRAVEEAETARARSRRSAADGDDEEEAAAQSLEAASGVASVAAGAVGAWASASTPCAKRVFCEAMLRQADDAVHLTEKKMATYLAMLSGSGAGDGDAAVGWHLADVMRAVRRGECDRFRCAATGPRRR